MALVLAGAGMDFEFTMSAAVELKKCEKVYLETYTCPFSEEKIKRAEKKLGVSFIRIGRDKVESDFLLKEAKKETAALVSGGDPLTATTHIILVMEAKKRGIEVKIFHNSSVYTSAPGKAGLQIYRFGKTASLVNPRPNYRPTSPLEIIRENRKHNLHSLVLLDTEPEPMEAKTALEMLESFKNAVVLSRIGHENEKITYGTIEKLKKKDLGGAPFAIIIPAKKLHPLEEEYLEMLK